MHVVVKGFQQFTVDVVKVFAQHDSHRVGARANHIHNLIVYFIPQQLGGASQQGHVNLKMNVADFHKIRFLVAHDRQAFFVFETGRTVPAYARKCLAVFSRALRAVKYQIPQLVYVGRECACIDCFQFGMQRGCRGRFNVCFKMIVVELHALQRGNQLIINHCYLFKHITHTYIKNECNNR